jgi:hypothetical protein
MASISNVSICNEALGLLKVDRISSMSEESTAARLCNRFFDEGLYTLLEAHDWNFASERKALAQSADTPVFGYTYQHQLPTDPYCLIVREVVDSNGYKVSEWKLEGRYILSDTASISIRYTKAVENYLELSPLFRTALSFYLAAQMAEPLTSSTTVSDRMFDKYRYFYKKAKTHDSKQGTPDKIQDSDFEFITARFS